MFKNLIKENKELNLQVKTLELSNEICKLEAARLEESLKKKTETIDMIHAQAIEENENCKKYKDLAMRLGAKILCIRNAKDIKDLQSSMEANIEEIVKYFEEKPTMGINIDWIKTKINKQGE